MATDKELSQSLIGTGTQNLEGFKDQTQTAVEQYFSLLDVVRIQTEFMNLQLNSFNEQARSVGELYAKAAADAMKAPFGV